MASRLGRSRRGSGWWVHRGLATRDRDGPAGVVGEVVVGGAEQGEVGQVGGSAVGPVADVVWFAPGGWAVAGRADAAAVAESEGFALGGAGGAAGAAEVE